MIRWGWIAFRGLACGLVLLYAALMSSHEAAFRSGFLLAIPYEKMNFLQHFGQMYGRYWSKNFHH